MCKQSFTGNSSGFDFLRSDLNGWVRICRLAMCQIMICQQKMEFLTDRTKNSRFAEKRHETRKLCRPRSKTLARQYCGHCTSLKKQH